MKHWSFVLLEVERLAHSFYIIFVGFPIHDKFFFLMEFQRGKLEVLDICFFRVIDKIALDD